MSVHSIHAMPAKRFGVVHACDAAALPSAHLAALTLIDVEAAAGGSHVGLPHDLYMVTAYCDEQLACRTAGDDGSLRVVVSALRTRPARFDTCGRGQLAVALLTPLGLLRAFAYPLDDLPNQRLPLRDLISAPAQALLHGALLDAPPPAARLAAGRAARCRATRRPSSSWH